MLNTTRNARERVSKLLLLYANEPEEVEVLPFGSVGVILGLKHTRTGDTLVSSQGPGSASSRGAATQLRDITPPPAVMSASIIPYSPADAQPVQDALHALARTDPSIRVEMSDGQLLMHGLGSLHLEIAEGRLREEWNVNFESGPRRVGYRESVGDEGIKVEDTWQTEAQGRAVTIQMTMEISSLPEESDGQPEWGRNLVLDQKGHKTPYPDPSRDYDTPMSQVARGLAGVLSASPHTGLPLSHVCVWLRDVTYPPSTDISLLAGASSTILRRALLQAGVGPLMEPYVRLKVGVDEEHFGRVMKNLTENNAEILELDSQTSASGDDDVLLPYPSDGLYIPPDWLSPSSAAGFKGGSSVTRMKRTIHAIAPLSRMLDFSTRLRALSGGHGTLDMVNAGFRRVDSSRAQEILQEIGRSDLRV